ncbi:hypothetical protein [Endozoicomonas sp. 4G]|uniref:hypothetical protein n=1 Tax=Endozoicomonas sp. 4G TaxID=2872754 RepID=UPI002078FA3B|nr:hypothetical protein [Endozoicomonas sp. 4G]
MFFFECAGGYAAQRLKKTAGIAVDKGYISFEDTGKIIISNRLLGKDQQNLGLHESMKLSRIEERHKEYLNYHRENIYESFGGC